VCILEKKNGDGYHGVHAFGIFDLSPYKFKVLIFPLKPDL
jgi:hypothetical protein